MASPELIERILQQYGYSAVHVRDMQTGYRSEIYPVELTSHTPATIILYKREPGIIERIKNANRIGDSLAEQGFPARRTLDARILTLNSSSSKTYAALYTYLPGATIPWEAYTMDHLKCLGATMSAMHTALSRLPQDKLPLVADEYHAIVDRMERYFTDPGVVAALHAKLNLEPPEVSDLHSVIKSLSSSHTQQALHMDFVRGNVLFAQDSSEISGILDFEKTAWGHPLFDVGRTLAFLLVDCKYKSEAKIRKYFLRSGYQKRGSAELTERQYLEPLLDLFLTYDFYKFLRHNPYESLLQNEHFTRTRNLLLTRHRIRMSKARKNMLQ